VRSTMPLQAVVCRVHSTVKVYYLVPPREKHRIGSAHSQRLHTGQAAERQLIRGAQKASAQNQPPPPPPPHQSPRYMQSSGHSLQLGGLP
jgi:hypothetical protein